LFVVSGEQDDEVARVLDRLVHHFDEACTNWRIVILHKDLVTLLGEHIGHLARDGGNRAATAQEEIVALVTAGGHDRVSDARPDGIACCACAAGGHAATAPPSTEMNSRRLICAPQAEDRTLPHH
jgi:hypothetical protein